MYEETIKKTMERAYHTLCAKHKEYATEDPYHNFNAAAELEGISPMQALAGMMAKHTVSVYDMCRGDITDYPSAVWDEKICDHINYLLLLRALVEDQVPRTCSSQNDTPESVEPLLSKVLSYRERLAEIIGPDSPTFGSVYGGGVKGCPDDYFNGASIVEGPCNDTCRECWDRPYLGEPQTADIKAILSNEAWY